MALPNSGVQKHLRAALGFLLGAALLAAGCGRGEYNRRLEAKLQSLDKDSPFKQWGPSVEITGSPFSLQFPPGMRRVPESDPAKRAKIPFAADQRDLKATFEGAVPSKDGTVQHYYCHVLALAPPVDPKRVGDPVAVTMATLTMGMLGDSQPFTWSERPCDSPTGATFSWRRCNIPGSQEFCLEKGKEISFPKTDGTMEVWTFTEPESRATAVLVWRVPKGLEGKDFANLDETAKLVAGTLSVKK